MFYLLLATELADFATGFRNGVFTIVTAIEHAAQGLW